MFSEKEVRRMDQKQKRIRQKVTGLGRKSGGEGTTIKSAQEFDSEGQKKTCFSP